MKHNIRQRVINQYGLPVTKVESVNGELGSGLFDKNGVEIFEGDKVKRFGGEPLTVRFHGGKFDFGSDQQLLSATHPSSLEIVGHVDD